MNNKCLETKTFTNNAKTSNFSTRKTSFSFSNLLRFHAVNIKDFLSDLRDTYTLNALQKLMQKDFFPSYWCNNTIFKSRRKWKKFFIFILLQNNATRKNDDKNKTKRMKRKIWLKTQIAKESEHKNEKKQSRKHQFQHLPKNHKTNIFSLLSFLSNKTN